MYLQWSLFNNFTYDTLINNVAIYMHPWPQSVLYSLIPFAFAPSLAYINAAYFSYGQSGVVSICSKINSLMNVAAIGLLVIFGCMHMGCMFFSVFYMLPISAYNYVKCIPCINVCSFELRLILVTELN